MTEPVIAAHSPVVVALEAGRGYFYCTCGRSADQPFCDGSHQGTSFTPLQFQVEEDRKAALCRCKRTADPPFCDGSHAALASAPEAPQG
jgi:CDGSH-type Zn-finger protein